MRLVLMGPPGAGKGTQGGLLERDLEIPRFATGDILREEVRAGTGLGREARRYMDAGELVPDEVILGMMRGRLRGPRAESGFLLDGFPRTVAQAEALDALLDDLDAPLDAVVDIVVPDDELVRRLSSRRVCSACGSVAQAGAGDEDACGECEGELRSREDDRPETVRRRLEVYREQTAPVLEWYADSAVPLVEIDGVGDVEDVHDRIREGIGA